MTIWLTLLLVWTTGIPAALFATATLAVVLGERRTARPTSFSTRRVHATTCGRRAHAYGPSRGSGRELRARVGARRPV